MLKFTCAAISAAFSFGAYHFNNDTLITVAAVFAAAALVMEHTTHCVEKHQ